MKAGPNTYKEGECEREVNCISGQERSQTNLFFEQKGILFI